MNQLSSKKSRGRGALVIIACVFVLIGTPLKSREIVAIDWVSLTKTYAAYEKHPDAQHADAVWKLLPGPEDRWKFSNSKDETDTIDYIYDHLGVLDSQLKRGDAAAMRLAFRFFAISDGDFGERLDQIIGSQIVARPRLFLRLLKENRKLVRRLDGLMGNNGIVDDLAADCKDYHERIAALKSVEDANLEVTRDEAIKELSRIENAECTEHKTN